ncbi:MAG: hypothetical protein ACREIU_06630, partial [Planctomycetota bacterium]
MVQATGFDRTERDARPLPPPLRTPCAVSRLARPVSFGDRGRVVGSERIRGLAMEHGSRRGSVLFILLFSVVLVGGAIASLVSVEQARSGASRTDCERQRAFALAESATDTVAVLLNANAWPAGTVLDWSSDGLDNDGDGLVDEGDESLRATADLWGSDAADNDGDGSVDESDERVARVSATVALGTSQSTMTGWLRLVDASLPETVPAPLTLLDPNADVDFNGNALRVDGADTNLDGTPAGPSTYGIAIDGSPAQVTSQLSAKEKLLVGGLGGAPSVGTWTPGMADYVQTMVDSFAPYADIVFHNYTKAYSGSLGNWKTSDYLITHSKGSFKISGGSVGAGLLLVEGDLEISGGWDYAG